MKYFVFLPDRKKTCFHNGDTAFSEIISWEKFPVWGLAFKIKIKSWMRSLLNIKIKIKSWVVTFEHQNQNQKLDFHFWTSKSKSIVEWVTFERQNQYQNQNYWKKSNCGRHVNVSKSNARFFLTRGCTFFAKKLFILN